MNIPDLKKILDELNVEIESQESLNELLALVNQNYMLLQKVQINLIIDASTLNSKKLARGELRVIALEINKAALAI